MRLPEMLQPKLESDPRPPACSPDYFLYLRSYLFMRTLIGIVGVALPFVLVLGDAWYFDATPFWRGSLSAYYFSPLRDVFVGSLSAIAVFLITYKVVEATLDNTLSVVAGLAAVVVAVFPTKPGDEQAITRFQERVGVDLSQTVHFVAAFVFITALAAICWLFGVREGRREPRPGKRSPTFWRWFHWTCSLVIVASLVFVGAAELFDGPDDALLIAETVSVLAFATSWFVKGFELDVLLGRRRPTDRDLAAV